MTLGRPPKLLRPVKLNTTLPEDVRAQLEVFLWSPLEGRVPYGAYNTFLLERIREFFSWRRLEIDTPAGKQTISGPAEALSLIKEALHV
jgi:hypothetical protein